MGERGDDQILVEDRQEREQVGAGRRPREVGEVERDDAHVREQCAEGVQPGRGRAVAHAREQRLPVEPAEVAALGERRLAGVAEGGDHPDARGLQIGGGDRGLPRPSLAGRNRIAPASDISTGS